MPAQPALGLHANRKLSVPSLTRGSRGINCCFSVKSILTGKVQSAFGSGQSMDVCTDGEAAVAPPVTPAVPANTWPKVWYTPGRIMKVPRTVILSSLPFWPCFWPSTYFYGNRDVIGLDGLTGLFGNYYYFDQWNTVDSGSGGTPFPLDTSKPDATYTYGNPNYDYGYIQTAANNDLNEYNCSQLDGAVSIADFNASVTIQATPDYQAPGPVNGAGPIVRYSQVVGTAANNYYTGHQSLIDAFITVKKQLETGPDPIFVLIPQWMPYRVYQCFNSFLTRSAEQLNGAHGGSVNGQPCDVSDSIPCYNYVPVLWDPVYPDVFDPRNSQGFNSVQVPWLVSTDPGFGTNVLHMYIGHPVMKYSTSSSIFDYQSFPLTPEVQWIAGPTYQGAYTGSSIPYFAGRRDVWDSTGFDYGYTGTITPASLYATRYSGIVSSAAATYKQNFYNYRQFTTMLYSYKQGISCTWSTSNIGKDRENTCPATQFYFGYNTFGDFSIIYDNVDDYIADCEDSQANPAHLKFGESQNYFPSLASIEQAIGDIYPGIINRITTYYASIDLGSRQFYQLSIDNNDLANCNVSVQPPYNALGADPDSIIEAIQAYFAKNP